MRAELIEKAQDAVNAKNDLLATIAYIATGAAGALIIAEPDTLGVTENTLQMIAGWLALGGTVFGVAVIAIRRNMIPGVETGIANDPQPGTDTLKIETTHTPAEGTG